jgi:hypothetical protein
MSRVVKGFLKLFFTILIKFKKTTNFNVFFIIKTQKIIRKIKILKKI